MRVVRLYHEGGYRHGLLVKQTKRTLQVITTEPNRNGNIGIATYPADKPVTQAKLLKGGESIDYPVPRAKKHLRRLGRRYGLSDAAKAALV